MRKLLATLILLLAILPGKAQMRISASGEVSNFHQNYDFTKTCNYDHDSERQYGHLPANSTVTIRVDEDGMGYVSIFLESKVRFGVVSCIKKGDNYLFQLINSAGQTVQASLVCSGNKVNSFWLHKESDNTSILFYY